MVPDRVTLLKEVNTMVGSASLVSVLEKASAALDGGEKVVSRITSTWASSWL